MRGKFSVFVVLAGSLLCCASSDQASSDETTDAIVRGELSPSSEDAVVYIRTPEGFCSGTVIAPKVVLTARHCVSNRAPSRAYRCGDPNAVDFAEDFRASGLTVAVGKDNRDPQQVVTAKALVHADTKAMCDQDVALLVLEEPVDVTPRSIRSAPISAGLPLSVVGWGMTEAGSYPYRRHRRSGLTVLTKGPIDGVDGHLSVGRNEFTTSEAICFGDSGGPFFDAEGRVAGVVSRFNRVGALCVVETSMHADVTAYKSLIARALDMAEGG